jgi:hypothetical protein
MTKRFFDSLIGAVEQARHPRESGNDGNEGGDDDMDRSFSSTDWIEGRRETAAEVRGR